MLILLIGRQLKNDLRSSTPLTVNVISGASGKPAIAEAAQCLFYDVKRSAKDPYQRSKFSTKNSEVGSIIEGTTETAHFE